jgi:hypothetical protein
MRFPPAPAGAASPNLISANAPWMPPLTGLNEDHFAPGCPMAYTMGFMMSPFQGSRQRTPSCGTNPRRFTNRNLRATTPPPTLENRIAPGPRRVILSRGLCGEGSRLAVSRTLRPGRGEQNPPRHAPCHPESRFVRRRIPPCPKINRLICLNRLPRLISVC